MKSYKSNQRRPKSISKNHVKKVIQDFCESTSLHGYSYLNIANSTVSKLIWTLIILAMTGLGSYFFVKNTNDYINARLVTNIETSSANLSVSNKGREEILLFYFDLKILLFYQEIILF